MAKVNISLPAELLEQIDEFAAEYRRSRSSLIQEAAASYTARLLEEREQAARRERIDRAVDSARSIANALEPGDSTPLIRAGRERDGRETGQR